MAAHYTTTHEGQTATRRSAGHKQQQYFWAVWVLFRNGPRYQGDPNPRVNTTWSCEAYSSRADLAHKRAADYREWAQDVAVVPVNCVIKTPKAKPAVELPGDTFEIEGLQFGPDADPHYGWSGSRVATYKGYLVRVSLTGKTGFRASASLNGNENIYLKLGRLDTRVKEIKARIDARTQ